MNRSGAPSKKKQIPALTAQVLREVARTAGKESRERLYQRHKRPFNSPPTATGGPRIVNITEVAISTMRGCEPEWILREVAYEGIGALASDPYAQKVLLRQAKVGNADFFVQLGKILAKRLEATDKNAMLIGQNWQKFIWRCDGPAGLEELNRQDPPFGLMHCTHKAIAEYVGIMVCGARNRGEILRFHSLTETLRKITTRTLKLSRTTSEHGLLITGFEVESGWVRPILTELGKELAQPSNWRRIPR